MNYSAADRILYRWAERHGLHVDTRHREDEVRSIPVVDDEGGEYQIFLSPPDARGQLRVTASKRRAPSIEIQSDIAALEHALEQAYQVVARWIAAAGHTRTPVL